MDRGWNSDFVFYVDRAKYRGGIYWLLFAASVVWPDWLLGLPGEASRHYVFTAILRHSWLYWHGTLVLKQKTVTANEWAVLRTYFACSSLAVPTINALIKEKNACATSIDGRWGLYQAIFAAITKNAI